MQFQSLFLHSKYCKQKQSITMISFYSQFSLLPSGTDQNGESCCWPLIFLFASRLPCRCRLFMCISKHLFTKPISAALKMQLRFQAPSELTKCARNKQNLSHSVFKYACKEPPHASNLLPSHFTGGQVQTPSCVWLRAGPMHLECCSPIPLGSALLTLTVLWPHGPHFGVHAVALPTKRPDRFSPFSQPSREGPSLTPPGRSVPCYYIAPSSFSLWH